MKHQYRDRQVKQQEIRGRKKEREEGKEVSKLESKSGGQVIKIKESRENQELKWFVQEIMTL